MITKEEENPCKKGDTKGDKESKNKYQTALCLLQPKAGIGTNLGQAENKTKAKYQTALWTQTILAIFRRFWAYFGLFCTI